MIVIMMMVFFAETLVSGVVAVVVCIVLTINMLPITACCTRHGMISDLHSLPLMYQSLHRLTAKLPTVRR